jgi:hypothetical protein
MSATLTFVFIVATFVVFRAETFGGALNVLSAMFGGNGVVLPEGLSAALGGLQPWLAQHGVVIGEHTPNRLASWSEGFKFIFILLLIAWAAPNTQQIMKDFEPAFDTYRGGAAGRLPAQPGFSISPAWAVIVALVFVYAVGSMTRASEFLYFQF